MIQKDFPFILVLIFTTFLSQGYQMRGQCYWQQHVDYKILVSLDVESHQMLGKEILHYTNNSPDTLHKVFYHLYYNAFQPNSMMDVRSRNIADPDRRVGDRIAQLNEDEIGYQEVTDLTQDENRVSYSIDGTILEVRLAKPLLPGNTTKLEMQFRAQVPAQIRRTGRDNAEGIDYSMSQWYPKLCAYDEDGWHTNPYVGREFYGNWGDFEVSIALDKNYIVAATGTLEKKREMLIKSGEKKGDYLQSYTFKARNVHDFVWAADPNYVVSEKEADCGVLMKFYHQTDTPFSENWAELPEIMNEVFNFANAHFGSYPYPIYSFIQGGDGGMEYPMATLITGERSLRSLVGVSVHELMHSWYQMMLATDEAQYAWMDEGFTSYTSAIIMNHLVKEGFLPGESVEDPIYNTRKNYAAFLQRGPAEPLSTHADHFGTNAAYSVASYVGGSVILDQLGYVISDSLRDKGLVNYFNQWKFKHPTPHDFFRTMERVSDIELDWMRQYFVNTTKMPDFQVDTVVVKADVVNVRLANIGKMPYPLDIKVGFENGEVEYYNIPLRIMRGHKPVDALVEGKLKILPDWPWTHPFYEFNISLNGRKLKQVVLNPKQKGFEANVDNNVWPPIVDK